jgi:hypothetical protein
MDNSLTYNTLTSPLKRTKTFVRGFEKGLAAPLMMFERPSRNRLHAVQHTDYLPMPSRSDLDSLRSDWLKIGADFHTVIAREQAKTAAR